MALRILGPAGVASPIPWTAVKAVTVDVYVGCGCGIGQVPMGPWPISAKTLPGRPFPSAKGGAAITPSRTSWSTVEALRNSWIRAPAGCGYVVVPTTEGAL